MKVLLQRVSQASIVIDNICSAQIQRGILALVCIEPHDTDASLNKMLSKALALRIFADAQQKMNLSLQDINGDLLLVSQFTLAADTQKGTRPGFSAAAPAAQAKELFSRLISLAKEMYPNVQHGVFGADMQITLTNDGPVTIPMDF